MDSRSVDVDGLEDKKKTILKILEEHNNQEALVKEKATRYYEILGVSEEATQEEVKKAYRKLSIINHPDKGGDPELFGLINRAYEVLGSEIRRKKYDLGLSSDEEGNFLNLKKFSIIRKSKELVNEEFRKDIELILQDELKLNDLTWEDLNWIGENI